ncbi:unnamed protein product [Protopolystoma xenopodis]|uniref:Uncharacterized protein n=1 Tax=Protopolystoma xenopodis TaxID=117903 RepID=A0A3S5A6T5_9PLAT|nr:unnamed protein product [Protopolystoma xenopodis]
MSYLLLSSPVLSSPTSTIRADLISCTPSRPVLSCLIPSISTSFSPFHTSSTHIIAFPVSSQHPYLSGSSVNPLTEHFNDISQSTQPAPNHREPFSVGRAPCIVHKQLSPYDASLDHQLVRAHPLVDAQTDLTLCHNSGASACLPADGHRPSSASSPPKMREPRRPTFGSGLRPSSALSDTLVNNADLGCRVKATDTTRYGRYSANGYDSEEMVRLRCSVDARNSQAPDRPKLNSLSRTALLARWKGLACSAAEESFSYASKNENANDLAVCGGTNSLDESQKLECDRLETSDLRGQSNRRVVCRDNRVAKASQWVKLEGEDGGCEDDDDPHSYAAVIDRENQKSRQLLISNSKDADGAGPHPWRPNQTNYSFDVLPSLPHRSKDSGTRGPNKDAPMKERSPVSSTHAKSKQTSEKRSQSHQSLDKMQSGACAITDSDRLNWSLRKEASITHTKSPSSYHKFPQEQIRTFPIVTLHECI